LKGINDANNNERNERDNLKEADCDDGVRTTRSGRAVCRPERYREDFLAK
jgi:hypothetical protein